MREIVLLLLMLFSTPSFSGESKSIKVTVDGMTCPMCAGKVETELSKIKTISDTKIDISKGIVTLETKTTIKDEEIEKAIKRAGFQVKKVDR